MYNNIATIYKATMTAFLIVKNYVQKLYIYIEAYMWLLGTFHARI